MGANQGASGNKLQTKNSEISIAVAANLVAWSAQDLESNRHEKVGERFVTNVATLAGAAFAEIAMFGTTEDKASLVARLNDVLNSQDEIAQDSPQLELDLEPFIARNSNSFS